MNKILLSLVLMVGLVGFLYGTNDHYKTPTTTAVTGLWTKVYHDTFTVDSISGLKYGPYKITFDEPVFNLTMNEQDADSDYVTVVPKNWVFPIKNSKTVAEALETFTLGDLKSTDTLTINCGVTEIWIYYHYGPLAAPGDSNGVKLEFRGLARPKE